MLLKVQDTLKNQLKKALNGPEAQPGLFTFSDESPEILIGDLGYLTGLAEEAPGIPRLLITDQGGITSASLHQVARGAELYIAGEDSPEQVAALLGSLRAKAEKARQVGLIKVEIQKKRKELEFLNNQLSSESERRIESLEKSHIEETEKNQNEKSLLHFLDFIQSESTADDYIEKIFRFIWKDLKKSARVHTVGLVMAAKSFQSKILSYDGFEESSAVAEVNFPEGAAPSQLATAWGRPVGKIMWWPLPETSRESYLFLELVEAPAQPEKINTYFSDRVAVLSMYLDRWMIEKEIEVAVDRWKNTFRSFSGFIHVVDEEFRIYQSNYPHERGAHCYRALAGRDSPCENCPVLKNKSTQFVLRGDLSVKTHFSQFKFQDKKYFFVIYEDMTKLNLLHSNIIQTEKMSTLGRLGNHLAHELNNPLTGIKSYLQTLLMDPAAKAALPATAESDLNEILKATVRCQRIIKNFIDFSHKKEPSLEKVVFNEVVQNTIVLLKTALRSHRLFIDLKADQVMANSHDLQQVLFNLIKNSCQAMTENGTIKIYQEDHGRQIWFNVEDSGPGFSESILKNIFQPFMTTKPHGEGTGLGLYLSKQLMNNMNADLQITSSPGKGAKISLIFDKL